MKARNSSSGLAWESDSSPDLLGTNSCVPGAPYLSSAPGLEIEAAAHCQSDRATLGRTEIGPPCYEVNQQVFGKPVISENKVSQRERKQLQV